MNLVKRIMYLDKEYLDVLLSDICVICLRTHSKRTSILCRCNHSFGSICFKQWISICNKQNKNIVCPICRYLVRVTTSYREV